jgi:hydroxymethylpyrimidine/phosphomethylpyrimidine kinase
MTIGGHDPSGGAGVQADIEALAANGAHAVTLISSLTLQDSCNIRELYPVEPELLRRQAELLLADCRVSAIKVGLLGSPEVVKIIADLLRTSSNIPVVLDPVLAAGGGRDIAGASLLSAIRRELLPLCDLITPNIPEAIRLSGLEAGAPTHACAQQLLSFGPGGVLITGTHDPHSSSEITHQLFRTGNQVLASRYLRLAGEYHGSGCTLAASIAAHLARGVVLEQAVKQGLDFTWQSLRHGFRSGRCQVTPDRLFRLSRSSGGAGE